MLLAIVDFSKVIELDSALAPCYSSRENLGDQLFSSTEILRLT